MTEIFFQIAGWIGTILIVVAYFLVSKQYVQSKSRTYQLMNLFGALGVGINVWHQQAWPSVALQIIWAIIAVASLVKSK